MSEYLDRLKNLTEKLPSFPDIIERHLTKNGKIEQYYEMDEGNCYAVYLHRSGDDIAVHRWFNSKGGKFPKHNHNEKEWIVIYKGSMILLRCRHCYCYIFTIFRKFSPMVHIG
jgi:hypothetical protein